MCWFRPYSYDGTFDEYFAAGEVRPLARPLFNVFQAMPAEEILARKNALETMIQAAGITFTVYGEMGNNIDRPWPLDPIPRLLAKSAWDSLAQGLQQRLRALNAFIHDFYHEQTIVQEGILPRELLTSSENVCAPCQGMRPKFDVWAHICGTDLVRDADGTMYVLEDNLRVPSGVSYLLENRQLLKKVFPEWFKVLPVLPVDSYPSALYRLLASVSPRAVERPVIAILTPGVFNSAYFEHWYLAQSMGVYLVEGRDLVVPSDNTVYMKTIAGLQRVDVLYRRINDEFLDPEVFRPDSLVGVPGLMRAWRAGNVAIVNAPGSGVADDKVIYAFVPEMIRYYLNEKPILPNVPTWLCYYPEQQAYVLANLDKLVVKPVNASGGSGMLIGPKASEEERAQFAQKIQNAPRNYIAQPTLQLSTAPILEEDHLSPRHIDLRPFILQGADFYVTPGGLTRVAMRSGSLVVNSSQGGGSKDTWVVDDAYLSH